MNYFEKLELAYKSIRSKTDFEPAVAVILGSGLGGFADLVKAVDTIPYNEIEGFPTSTVEGHKGQFVFGYIEDTPVVIMQGRVHYYEGYEMTDVVMPVRLMGMLGAKVLFLSNAAGGINLEYKPGTLMMIKDHISSFVPSPLIGANLPELGLRFPDMTHVYDRDLQDKIRSVSNDLGITLEEGVYVQFTGPQFETPTEIVMCRNLGADAVGMSTVCEAIAAHHMGIKVCGVSCITNLAAGISGEPLNHEEVQETADRVAKEFQSLVYNSVKKIGKSL